MTKKKPKKKQCCESRISSYLEPKIKNVPFITLEVASKEHLNPLYG